MAATDTTSRIPCLAVRFPGSGSEVPSSDREVVQDLSLGCAVSLTLNKVPSPDNGNGNDNFAYKECCLPSSAASSIVPGRLGW